MGGHDTAVIEVIEVEQVVAQLRGLGEDISGHMTEEQERLRQIMRLADVAGVDRQSLLDLMGIPRDARPRAREVLRAMYAPEPRRTTG